jgi:WD40 repeat protein
VARKPGFRDKVFALLARAKALHVPEKDMSYLRQEAVACLGDFVGLTPTSFTNFSTKIVNDYLDPAGNVAGFEFPDGSIQLRQMPSGAELAFFNLTNEFLQDFCFNSKGNFIALCGSNSAALHSWVPAAGTRWVETEMRPLPPFTIRLLNGKSRTFGVKITQLGKPFPFTLQPGTIRKVFVFDSSSLPETEGRLMEFRLLDAESREFISGYVLTNAAPRNGELSFYMSGDAQVLAVETYERTNPNPAPTQTQAHTQDSLALVHRTPFPVQNEGQNSMSLVNLYDWPTGRLIAQFERRINGSLAASAPLYFSEDGKYLVSLTELGGTIYSVPALERIAQFMGPYYGKAPRICGDTVAIPEANRLRLYSLRRKEEIALLDAPDDVRPADFSADGTSLLLAGGKHAWLYRLVTPEKLDLPHHAGAVAGVAFSPNGARLVSVGKDRVVRVCDSRTGGILWETNDLPGLGQCVSYSPDGKWLAIGVWDRDLVTIRDAETGRWLLDIGTGRADRTTYCLQISPDGRHLAVAADTLRLWAINSQTSTFDAEPLYSWNGIAMSPVFSPDSRLLSFCSCYDDYSDPPENWNSSSRPVYIWDFARRDPPRTLAWRIVGQPECAGFAPDSREMLVMNIKGDILNLDVATGKTTATVHARDPQFSAVTEAVVPSPDASKVALAITPPSGGAVSILDSKTGDLLYSLPAETGAIYWLAWNPDSRRIAVARDNGKIAIWDLEEVKQILAKLGLNP